MAEPGDGTRATREAMDRVLELAKHKPDEPSATQTRVRRGSQGLQDKGLAMAEPRDSAQATTEAAHGLLELAKAKFGELSQAEEKLLESAATGVVADYSADSEEENHPATADNWGRERVLRADRIAWLCTDLEASSLVSHQGIRARGVRIDGVLRLPFARIPFPLLFTGSAFRGPINLTHAEIRALSLPGTHTGAIHADGLKVDASVFLRDGFRAEGETRFIGATIQGDLTCDGGEFINPDGVALSAEGAKVGGNVFLRYGFRAEGEVRLLGATIGGQLNCENGRFIHAEGFALNANGADVKGSVFLRDGFKAEGEVRLRGASIGGQLDCNTGQCIRPDGYAFSADGLKVAGNVFLGYGFRASGRVSFVSASIGRHFVWTKIAEPHNATLDLRSARIGTLWDDVESWPGKGKLFLHGLVYDEIYERAPVRARARIDWLQRQPEYHPQPFEQLAKVLRQMGREEDATRVLIAKQSDHGRFAGLSWSDKGKHWALGATMRYGYRPWRVLWFALVVVMVGWGLFWWGASPGLEPKTGQEALTFSGSEAPPSGSLSCLTYSLDVFLPLVELHQEDHWLPNPNGKGRIATSQWALILSGNALRWWMWFEILAGWVLTALFVAGVTGLVRRRYEP